MSARDEVVAAAEVLRIQLPLLKDLWPEERWNGFQQEFLDWLGEFERCRIEEHWLAAWEQLRMLATTYDLLDIVESAWLHAAAIPDVADPLTSPERSLDWHLLVGDEGRPPRSVRELAARLRRFLDPTSTSQVRPIEAYPEARVEGDVFEQQAFMLEVMVHAEPTQEASHKATLPRSRGGAVDLEVVLSLPEDGAITFRSPHHHPLRVPEGCDSNRIAFELFAVRPGRHRVDVRFQQGGVTRAEITVPVLVLAAHERPSPGAVSPGVRTVLYVEDGCALPSLVLKIEQHAVFIGGRTLRVTLMDNTGASPVDDLIEIAEDSQQRLVASCQRLGAELVLRPAETREDWLRGVGAQWAAHLLPARINERLASSRYPEGTSLHIESRTAWLPWELFFVGSPSRGRFLGDWFAVTRWHSHAQLRSHLAGTHAVLVAPRDSGLCVDNERGVLERLTSAQVEEIRTLREFQERVRREAPMGFLHFACHGIVESSSHSSRAAPLLRDVVPEPADLGHPPLWHLRGMLLLEDQVPLQTSDVPRYPDDAPSPLKGAFVFLNACQAGLPSSSPWGHESWVNTFFEAGAVAMIAPSWTISDACAGVFSQRLYERLALGETLAQATRWARGQLPRGGAADRLGYAVYAFPEARRSRSLASPRNDAP